MLRKPSKLYILIIFGDVEQRTIIYIAKFNKIKDILDWTNNRLHYCDVKYKKNRNYRTWKCLFRIVKLTQYEKMKYFYLN